MSAFLAPAVRALSDAFLPLRTGFSSLEEVEAFLARYGWDIDPSTTSDLDAIRQTFALISALGPLGALLDEFINGPGRDDLSVTLDLLTAAKDAVIALRGLVNSAGGGLPAAPSGFWTELADQLVDDLVADYLERHQPLVYAALHVASIIRYDRVPPTGPAPDGRIVYTRTTIHWNKLAEALTKPGDLLAGYYGWGGATFHHQLFFRAIERSMLAFRLHPSVQPPRPGLLSHINSAEIVPQELNELEAPLIDGASAIDHAWWKIGLLMLPVPPTAGSSAPATGLLIRPLLQGQGDLGLRLTRDIKLQFSAGADATSVITAKVFPGSASVTVSTGDATIGFSGEITGTPKKPYLLFGARDSHRLELDGFTAAVGVRGQVSDPEVWARVGTGDDAKLRLVVDFAGGESDGFINKLMASQEKLEVEIGTSLLWSSKKGLSFEGSAAVDFVKHIHRELGPVTIETLHVKASGGTGGMHLDFGVGLKGAFGPVTMVVEDIGVRMTLEPTSGADAGAFGNLDIDFGFKPPNGVGIAIDAGMIKGGGYLYFDYDAEQYAGALEFELAGYIRLTAVGLLTTRMPDGTKGFSLLIIITAEFGTGIQIGMGFSLLGVGGLLGLNRTMVLQELVSGVRTGAVNSIMFPTDVVANAPRIISDLKVIFPPKQDVFLVGPMAKLGWGTPTLVTLSVGLIIEIPGNIAIVGVLKLCLPNADDPVLVLQANFVGAVEFDKKRIYFFAALFDSRVLSMTLDGELGVLAKYGDSPDFIFCLGGFNPRFKSPALPFPTPARVSINILNQSNARVRVMTYFAVTSNTAQLGARADLYFGFSKCSMEGFIGFDALFQFEPFHFVIDAGAALAAKVFNKGLFSVSVQMQLKGPAPWRVVGSGTLSLRWFDIDFDFGRTWGEVRNSTQPAILAMDELEAEFDKDEAWSAVWPDSANLLVSLRKIDPQPDTVVLHPVGKLRVSQKKVPLDLGVSKIGARQIDDVSRVTLAVTGTDFAKTGNSTEKFAMAQFLAMDDAAKLSRPGFEDGFGGIELGAAGADLAASQAVVRTVRYEESVIDLGYKRRWRRWLTISYGLYEHFLHGGVLANSAFSVNAQTGFVLPDVVTIANPGWAVAYEANNAAVAPDAMNFVSETMAQDYLNQQMAAGGAGQAMHIIAAYEVAQ